MIFGGLLLYPPQAIRAYAGSSGAALRSPENVAQATQEEAGVPKSKKAPQPQWQVTAARIMALMVQLAELLIMIRKGF